MNFRPLLDRLPGQTRLLLQTVVYGLGAGAAAVAFQTGINGLFRGTFIPLSGHSFPTFLVGTLALVLGTSLVAGWLLNSFCRDAAGSGIPQLKAAYWKEFGFVPARVIWVKLVAGILSIGGGSSLGREGPSVQLAGAVGSNLAGWMGEPKQNRRLAAAAGAAAGLAAAFNTPLAAITFVLEEIVQDLNSRILGSVLLASVIGAFVVHGIVGRQPAFALAPVDPSGWAIYLLVPVVAAVAALVGVGFQRATLALRGRCRAGSLERVPAWMRPAIGALAAWMLGVAVFWHSGHLGVFSLGYDDLSAGLAGRLDAMLAGELLAMKFAATVLCYGLGGCGGIFSPTLFFGGMCGLALGGLAMPLVPLSSTDPLVLAVVGMSACLGAVVRAPVTGILIVFEMTHDWGLVPALMLGALVSQAVSRRLLRHSFYDAILAQDGHRLEHVIPPRDLADWQQRPVSALATTVPALADSLDAGALRKLLRTYPYQRFPVQVDGALRGVLTRVEAEAALSEKRMPELTPAVCCQPTQSVRELQQRLLESPTGLVVVQDHADNRIVGVVTWHDLLRAEMTMADKQNH
jgi:chloride channel protein, CIC family